MKFSYLEDVYVIPSDMRGTITKITPEAKFPYEVSFHGVTFYDDKHYGTELMAGDFKEDELRK